MPYQTCCTEIIFVPPQFRKRNISECIASLPSDSTAFIDAGFAADVEAAIAAPPGALGVSALGLVPDSQSAVLHGGGLDSYGMR
jgi:hypothetical protein